MFKTIIHHPGFWRSVFALGTAFVILFGVFKWFLDGYSWGFFTGENALLHIVVLFFAAAIYGFFVTYGKFWKKLKEKNKK